MLNIKYFICASAGYEANADTGTPSAAVELEQYSLEGERLELPVSTQWTPGVELNRQNELDDIKIIPHPSTDRVEQIFSFNDYCNATSTSVATGADSAESVSGTHIGLLNVTRDRASFPPWHPFRSRLDFEIAEVIQSAQMKEPLIAKTISLIKQAAGDPASASKFTLTGLPEYKKVWDYARDIRCSNVRIFYS